MSHHYSGPDFGFPHGDARLDLTDVYVFPKPGDTGKSILVMNVHPSVSVSPPGPTTAQPFSNQAVYEFRIDTDGDLLADMAYRVRFSRLENGAQAATLRLAEGGQVAGVGDDGRTILEGAPVSTGEQAYVAEAGGYRLFAGWRSGPFFFDTLGGLNGGENALWARTVDGRDGKWVQAERGARPSQSVFLTGSEKAAYFAVEPAEDARFVAVYAHSLEHTGGYTPQEATRVAQTLLPDVLRYDPSRPARFPDNGRALLDDVMDGFIAILTNGKVTGDGVHAHSDLLDAFPFLGPPHQTRAAESMPG